MLKIHQLPMPLRRWLVCGVLAGLTGVAGEAGAACGTPVEVAVRDGVTVRVTLGGLAGTNELALVLLVGGGGHLDLDAEGCPRNLKGNSLVRKRRHFHAAKLITALVDAPSDHQGPSGLGGFRITSDHADDIGRVIAAVRQRTGLPVWLAGTSRGSISAVNAAARLAGAAAPDGVILTSPITDAPDRARKPWVTQSVFTVDLAAIDVPVLVVAHADDTCVRTPPDRAARIVEETAAGREQTAIVTGGPGAGGATGVAGCKGRSPHGFLGQEAMVAAGMARFMGGGTF